MLGIATRTTWPLRLAVHRYQPDRGLYEARPIGRIKLDIPTHWFLSLNRTSPLRNLVMADLDGDGLDDLGFNHDENYFEIYTAKSNFSKKGSYRFRLPKTKLKLEAVARAHNGRPGAVILRGHSTLYLIRTPNAARASTN